MTHPADITGQYSMVGAEPMKQESPRTPHGELGVIQHMDSDHWASGGTGIINFSPDDFTRYCEAVKRNGDDRFVVSANRMLGRGRDAQGGSLHFLGDIRTEQGGKDVSKFWRCFEGRELEVVNG